MSLSLSLSLYHTATASGWAELDDDEKFVEQDTAWSPPFPVNNPGNFLVRLGEPLSGKTFNRLRVVCVLCALLIQCAPFRFTLCGLSLSV